MNRTYNPLTCDSSSKQMEEGLHKVIRYQRKKVNSREYIQILFCISYKYVSTILFLISVLPVDSCFYHKVDIAVEVYPVGPDYGMSNSFGLDMS